MTVKLNTLVIWPFTESLTTLNKGICQAFRLPSASDGSSMDRMFWRQDLLRTRAQGGVKVSLTLPLP